MPVRIGYAPPGAAAVVVERVLREARHPVHAVRLIGIEPEHLGFTNPAVDRTREHDRVIAEDIGQCDRGAAEHAAAEVVALISDRRPHVVVGREPDPVGAEGELIRVRQRQRRRIEQLPHRQRRWNRGRVHLG